MTNVAVIVGNTTYWALPNLGCCADDVLAINELLAATEKYDRIVLIENADADDLKSRLRDTIDQGQAVEELFFYFTGHGYQNEQDFFYCSTNFESKRPNETGLSTTELHTLLKLADANVVVKVVDACNSGTLLVKSDPAWGPLQKGYFKNLVQIASCLDSQNSLTGEPLSVFTEKFRAATLRKLDGPVFYTDVISSLRDEFIDNESQTPFFVSQGTGRERFVDDAKHLEPLRKSIEIRSMSNQTESKPIETLRRVSPRSGSESRTGNS